MATTAGTTTSLSSMPVLVCSSKPVEAVPKLEVPVVGVSPVVGAPPVVASKPTVVPADVSRSSPLSGDPTDAAPLPDPIPLDPEPLSGPS